jgi:hypothetical protein
MSIIRSGIVLVTLVPEMEYTKGNLGLSQMVLALAEFTRAHGESLIKSERSRQHWKNQRDQGVKGRLTHVLPGWIERKNGTFRLIPGRAKIVRQIFAWSVHGIGAQIMARRLNEKGVPCFGRGKRWHKSYIATILRNRACVGEHQPHVIDQDGKRQQVGKAILNYFPPVVIPEIFAQAQVAVKSRNAVRGGINQHVTNLFARLIRDEDGHAWTVQNRNTRPYLVSTALMEGVKERQSSIPYRPFERCVLEWIKEVQLDSALDDPLPGLKAREADLVDRLNTFKTKMKTTTRLSTLLDLFDDLEKELEDVREEIQIATAPRDHALADTKLAIDYLDQADNIESVRRDLRHHLSLLLREIVVRIEGKFRSRKKVYYLTIRFTNGQERKVFFETPTLASGPWSETDDFPHDTMHIRSELINRDKLKLVRIPS